MLACTALVGCSNEDVIDNPNENPVKNGEKYYAAVNLAMPGSSSRAATLGGYVDGTVDENTVNNVVFFFLDANGNSCADAFYLANSLSSTDYTDDDSTTGEGDDAVTTLGSFDQKTSTIIVMENPTEIPSSIVAVINMGNITSANHNYGTAALLTNRPTLTQIQNVVSNYATTTWNAMPTTGMVMSNTAYENAAGSLVIGAPVSAANIIEAGSNESYEAGDAYSGTTPPVTIYVEKVLAKVNVNDETSNSQSNTGVSLIGKTSTTTGEGDDAVTTVGTSATGVTLYVDIDGWWLDSAPQKSLLLKNIDNINYTWAWNDITNYRSYWANSFAGTDQAYTNYKYSTGANNNTALYSQENTSQPLTVTEQENDENDNTYEVNNRTKVVVAATLKKNETDTEGVDLVKWYGKYYTKEAFLITFANLNDVKKYYTRTGDETNGYTYTSLTSNNLKLVWNTDKTNVAEGEISSTNQDNITVNGEAIRNYEAAVELDGVTELFTQNGTTMQSATIADVNTALRNISKVMYWNGGKTYYYVELEHHTVGTGDDATTYFGVVRNHLYEVNLTAISGLGTPVPNTEKIIIPEKPEGSDKKTYIAANVVIMSYRVVSQNATLQ